MLLEPQCCIRAGKAERSEATRGLETKYFRAEDLISFIPSATHMKSER